MTSSGFTERDWVVLGGYFALLAVTGWWFSRKKQSGTEDYFRAGRSIPFWAAAISLLATTQTAVTFIGVPQSSYTGDLTYLSSSIGGLIAAAVLALVFIPAYYRANVTTPYELLESRFGPGARVATSCAYIGGRMLASAARVFLGAIPISLIIFGDAQGWQIGTAVGVLMVVGIGYTLMGGIRSVIWTDVIQVVVYVGAAAVAVGVLLAKIPLSVGEIWGVLAGTAVEGGGTKVTVLQVGLEVGKEGMGFDPSREFTLLTAVFGFSLLMLAAYGTDQDFVQRSLTCKSAARGGLSVLTGVLVGIPVVALFLVLGLLLYVFYERPEIMGEMSPTGEGEGAVRSERAFLRFILTQMPPGLTGLMIAGVMAAGLSSVNSTLNSMSSAFVTDLYRRWAGGRSERHYLWVGRAGVVGAGVLLGVVAGLCIVWQEASGLSLLGFALSVMVFAYAGLLGVFITALFTRRGSSASVVAALLAGFFAAMLLQPWAWAWWAPLVSEQLAEVRLVYPWHLPIATAVAVAVCCIGKK